MICSKCKKDFLEEDIEVSHDIPKYLGGTDLDGRHLLCKKDHDEYEKKILIECYKYILNEDIEFSEDRRKNIKYMIRLKKYKSPKKIIIAKKIKEEFFK